MSYRQENKNMNNNVPYNELIAYLEGRLAQAEQKQVEQWINASEDNRQVFLDLKAIHDNTESLDLPEVDEAKALKNIHNDIDFIDKPSIRLTPMNLAWMFAAASVVIILIFYWMFYQQSQQKVPWQMAETTDSIMEIQLPDGSMAWLNKNSTLHYPELFSDTSRVVRLSGEAFFQVNPDPDKPFTVFANGAITRVLGTAFNVRARSLEDEVVVTVKEGKVAVTDSVKAAEKLILEPGERAILDKRKSNLYEESTADENYLSWKTRVLTFKETPIDQVLKQLSELYDVPMVLGDSSLSDEKFTFEFKDVDLDEAQRILTWGLKAKMDTVDNQLILKATN